MCVRAFVCVCGDGRQKRLQMKHVCLFTNKNMTRVRKSAVVQSVLRNKSVNGKFINRSYPSPYHVTQRF